MRCDAAARCSFCSGGTTTDGFSRNSVFKMQQTTQQSLSAPATSGYAALDMPSARACPPAPGSSAGVVGRAGEGGGADAETERKRLSQINAMKESVGVKLLERFGQVISTAELIDKAVMQNREQIDRLEKKMDDLRSELLRRSPEREYAA